MRVVHVIPTLDASTGGPPVAVAGWARATIEAGGSAVIVTTDLPGPPGRSSANAARAPIIAEQAGDLDVRLLAVGRPKRLVYSPSMDGVLSKLVRDADIVHAHTLYLYPTFVAARVSNRLRRPLVVSPHGALDPFILRRGRLRKSMTDWAWQRRALDGAAALVVTSSDEEAIVASHGLRAPIESVPLCLDLKSFLEARREPSQATGGPILVNHGRLAPKKGLDLLLEALPAIRRHLPGVRLRLIGPDDDGVGRVLVERAHALGVADRVDISGPLYGQDLRSAVASADLWLLPSATENFGIAVAEAMATGVPVAISREVSIAESATAAQAAVVIERDADRIAAVVVDLFARPERIARLRATGPAFARTFDLATAGTRLAAAYERAVDRHAALA